MSEQNEAPSPRPLPETLRALSERVPGRVRLGKLYHDGVQTIEVFDDTSRPLGARRPGAWSHVGTFCPAWEAGVTMFTPALRDIRAALEQECEARGWDHSLETALSKVPERRYFATVHSPNTAHDGGAFADSPTHALALALLRALERGD